MKLTIEEALNLVQRATLLLKLVELSETIKTHHRFGQVLFNILLEEVAESLVFTDNDFFHEKDVDIVLDKFYHSCVINSGE